MGMHLPILFFLYKIRRKALTYMAFWYYISSVKVKLVKAFFKLFWIGASKKSENNCRKALTCIGFLWYISI